MLSDNRSSIKLEKYLFEAYDTVQGLRRDNPLFSDLFNFAMWFVLRKAVPDMTFSQGSPAA